MNPDKALSTIVELVGSVNELARLLNVSQPHVSNWIAGRRKIPATKVKILVKLSQGQVTAKDLRPDIFD